MERSTPNPRKARLPRILSGTQEASDRKREMQRERQSRRREIKEAERMRRNTSTPSESDQDHPLIGASGGDFDAAEDRSEEDAPAPFHQHNDDLVLGRNIVTKQTAANHRQIQKDREDAEIAALVRDVVRLKVKSKISDAALDKMFKLFYEKHNTLVMLKENHVMAPNYTNGVRPYVTDRLLDIYTSLLLKEENPAMGSYYRKLDGLKSVPLEYLQLPPNSRTRLLRLETYVKLEEVNNM